MYTYNVCLEKSSDNIGSAVCVQRDSKMVYIVSQTADPISSEPFPRHTLYKKCLSVRSILNYVHICRLRTPYICMYEY